MTEQDRIKIKEYLDSDEISIEEINALKNDDFALFLDKYTGADRNLFSKLFLELGYRAEDLIQNSTMLRAYLFKDCTSLTSIVIPDSVILISWEAFSGCSSLKSVTIPDSVIEMDTMCFEKCSSLEEIKIPSSLKTIPGWCFSWCTALKNIDISDGVKQIGIAAFNHCESLETIYIPHSITGIAENAFNNCYNIKEVIYDGTRAEWTKLKTKSIGVTIDKVKFLRK